jgi:hypothetical protein
MSFRTCEKSSEIKFPICLNHDTLDKMIIMIKTLSDSGYSEFLMKGLRMQKRLTKFSKLGKS